MSRVVIIVCATILFLSSPIYAQSQKSKSGAEMIAQSKKLTAMDKNGCLIPDDEPVIVVCGASEETKKQRIFQDQISDNETNAARNERAAACIAGTGCIPAMSGGVGFGFGKVPPPAIPLEDVYRGLPEPDMVVQEGSSQEASIPPPQ